MARLTISTTPLLDDLNAISSADSLVQHSHEMVATSSQTVPVISSPEKCTNDNPAEPAHIPAENCGISGSLSRMPQTAVPRETLCTCAIHLEQPALHDQVVQTRTVTTSSGMPATKHYDNAVCCPINFSQRSTSGSPAAFSCRIPQKMLQSPPPYHEAMGLQEKSALGQMQLSVVNEPQVLNTLHTNTRGSQHRSVQRFRPYIMNEMQEEIPADRTLGWAMAACLCLPAIGWIPLLLACVVVQDAQSPNTQRLKTRDFIIKMSMSCVMIGTIAVIIVGLKCYRHDFECFHLFD